MPTPIIPGEKVSALARIAVMDPQEAADLTTILNNYEDIVNMIARQLPVFEYYNAYLTEVMSVFTDSELKNVGIYNNQPAGPINPNPVLIINSTVTGATSIAVNGIHLGILGNSTVEQIVISANKDLPDLYIGPGSSLSQLTATASGCFVNNIWIRNSRNAPGSLLSVVLGSKINTNGILVDEGAFYGGFANNGTLSACANPTTGLVAGSLTHDTLQLNWTIPGSPYLKIDVYYRKSGSGVWFLASDQIGDFLAQDAGFVFRKLEKDTIYDFRTLVTCINGGTAETILTNTTTTCC